MGYWGVMAYFEGFGLIPRLSKNWLGKPFNKEAKVTKVLFVNGDSVAYEKRRTEIETKFVGMSYHEWVRFFYPDKAENESPSSGSE